MGSGKRLKYSIRKYGVKNHKKEILKFFESRGELMQGERDMITIDMLLDKNCMNLKNGGDGGLSGLPKQTIDKISKAGNKAFKYKLDNDVVFKKQHSDKMSKVIKKAYEDGKIDKSINYDWSGKNHTIETKDKISNTKKGSGIGETNSQYGTCWVNKSGINKKIKKEIIDNYLNEGWTIGRKTEINGEKIKTSKLKEVDVKEIKKLLSVGELSQIKIAKLFGVHQETISKIKRNLIWVNVT
jgi:predicted XRE-type DNA-binding protein